MPLIASTLLLLVILIVILLVMAFQPPRRPKRRVRDDIKRIKDKINESRSSNEGFWKTFGKIVVFCVFLIGFIVVLVAVFEPSTFKDLTATGVLWGLGTGIFLLLVAWFFSSRER